MNIAIDCRSVFPGRGGIGRYAESISSLIPEQDNKNNYVLFTTEKQRQRICARRDVKQVPFSVGMIDSMWEQLRLPTSLHEFEVDLYHNPCFSLPIAQDRSYLVTTIHDVVFRERPDLVPNKLCEYLDRWTIVATQIANQIITVSQYSKNKIVKYYGISPDKIDVTYNGIDKKFSPKNEFDHKKIQAKYSLPNEFILYLGSVEKKKNISLLLDAYKATRKNINIPLVFAGGKVGQDLNLDQLIDEKQLCKHVISLGYVNEMDIVPLLSGATIFVYPSLYEGFGLPPLEAMACGTPVIVSDATSLPEVVGKSGIIFEHSNTDSLSEKIIELYKNKDLQKDMIKKGKKHIKKFTWDACAKQTIACYKKVVC